MGGESQPQLELSMQKDALTFDPTCGLPKPIDAEITAITIVAGKSFEALLPAKPTHDCSMLIAGLDYISCF